MSTVTRYGLATVSTLSDTRPGRITLSRLNDALDLANRSLDHYLPPNEESDSAHECSSNTSVVIRESKEKDSPGVLASRAVCLTTKLRRRMYSRAMKDIKQLKLRSDEAVKKMTHSVDLVIQMLFGF